MAAGVASRELALTRGVKQGDPISGLLFITVLEVCFKKLKAKWARLNERRSDSFFCLVIDKENDTLSNLRFADDVLLVAASLPDLKEVMNHLPDAMSE